MKQSVTTIDLGEERILNIASHMVDDHNYINALKMLNKCVEVNGNTVNTSELYAEIYDDLGLYEKSIVHWFRFIDHLSALNEKVEDADRYSADLEEAYEGLAIGYMNIGNDHFSAYYYNKLLMENGIVSPEERQELLQSFAKPQADHLQFIWPPRLVDHTQNIADGLDKMRQNNVDGAIACFEQVGQGNPQYWQARNYIAMCQIIAQREEEAEQEIMEILRQDPQNVQAMTTLCAIKTEQGKVEESKSLAHELLAMSITSTDDRYKIATVCCENGMHDEAYRLFCQLEEDMPYDSMVLYFKAISAFNSGHGNESKLTFDKLLAIYPRALIARFFRSELLDKLARNDNTPMSYFYRLPQEDRENSLKILLAYAALPDKAIKEFDNFMDLFSCIEWALDEAIGQTEELLHLAASCAVKARFDGCVREILLNPFYPDALKIWLLTELVERNVENNFGIVISHLYRNVNIVPITLGRAKRKYFIKAYAHVFARFAVLEDRYAFRIQNATMDLYDIMKCNDILAEAEDVKSLSAAIYLMSGIREADIKEDNIDEFFGADKRKVDRMLGEF